MPINNLKSLPCMKNAYVNKFYVFRLGNTTMYQKSSI